MKPVAWKYCSQSLKLHLFKPFVKKSLLSRESRLQILLIKSKCVAYHFHLRRLTSGDKNNVESANRHLGKPAAQVDLGCTNNLVSLAKIHRIDWIQCPRRMPGSNFYEDQIPIVTCYNINFTEFAPKIPLNDRVTVSFQIITSNPLCVQPSTASILGVCRSQ